MMNTNFRKLTAVVLTAMMLAGCTETAASVQNDEAGLGSKYTPVLTDSADAEKAAVDATEKLLTGFTETPSIDAGGTKDDLTKDITFDSAKVKSLTVDDSGVDYNTPGTYPIKYKVEVFKSALPDEAKSSDDNSDSDTQIVEIPATVEIKAKPDTPAEQPAESTDTQPQADENVQPAASDNNGTSTESSGTAYEAPKAAVVPSQLASTPEPEAPAQPAQQPAYQAPVSTPEPAPVSTPEPASEQQELTGNMVWYTCPVCGFETPHLFVPDGQEYPKEYGDVMAEHEINVCGSGWIAHG